MRSLLATLALLFTLAMAAPPASASVVKHVASDSKAAVVGVAKDGYAAGHYVVGGVYRGFRRGLRQVFGCK